MFLKLLLSFIMTLTYTKAYNIPHFFNYWTCLGIKETWDSPRPQASNIGELPLITWKNPVTNEWITCVNICKHMGSKLDNAIVTEDGCLKCQYHGLDISEKDKFGETVEHEGKIFWAFKPIMKTPPSVPFYKNNYYEKSIMEIDMDASLTDSAYNMMDLRHPEFVHNKFVGFGSQVPPQNIRHFYYGNKDRVGLSFDYISNDLMRRINENVNKTNNFHMFQYPSFTWSKVSFDKNNLIIGVNLLPLSKNKTRWFITICHNYYKSSVGKEFMKMLAVTILNQDFYQMANQYEENDLKKEVIFEHIFRDEEAILSVKKMFETYHYKYPDLEECVNLYKYFKNDM
jgi:phenylpropionate dioxygenase-like ring-hydroxylating dioxygenase large terminal subunit